MKGRILSIISQKIIVSAEDTIYTCTLRGVLKKEKKPVKNLSCVGDLVEFDPLSGQEGVIHTILPRKSVLSRADNLSRNKEQILAANIDQVLITASVVQPVLKPPLVDRYIIAARKGNMDPIILVNKMDLLELAEDIAFYQEFLDSLSKTAIPVIPLSVKTGEGLEDLISLMKNKSSVFSGQSGVGKSSLINAISKHELPVGAIVESTRKGSHTTTAANLLPLDFGGFVIDTPGIKSFGVWDLDEDEIRHYFEEIQAFATDCRFSNCSHTHEPGCAVLQAEQEGTLPSMRLKSYHALLTESREKHKRR